VGDLLPHQINVVFDPVLEVLNLNITNTSLTETYYVTAIR